MSRYELFLIALLILCTAAYFAIQLASWMGWI